MRFLPVMMFASRTRCSSVASLGRGPGAIKSLRNVMRLRDDYLENLLGLGSARFDVGIIECLVLVG